MEPFWQTTLQELFSQLGSSEKGLSTEEAGKRLEVSGKNTLRPPRKGKGLALFFSQFKSPLILLLIAAALLSFFLSAPLDASIILAIVFFSGCLGYFQERGALNALEKVMRLGSIKAAVRREGEEREILAEEIVPGDVLLLKAGDAIPADCRLFESHHLFIDESTITGESGAVEKGEDLHARERANVLFCATMVTSGFGSALVVATGKQTLYGEIVEKIRFRPPETAFEAGVKRFGLFLMNVTLILVSCIFIFNLFLSHPLLESFLFALAIAVGLTPQLLPAIISVNLSHGAKKMAKKKVIVKRLASIENFGQMEILCADKTGTLTWGVMEWQGAVGPLGSPSEKTKLYAYLNASFQTGYRNPLDTAILQKGAEDIAGWSKIDEIPYDFTRKRLSVVLQKEGKKFLITKGAIQQMFSICSQVELDGQLKEIDPFKKEIELYAEKQIGAGLRTLAVACGEGDKEENLTLLGFLHFFDPLKEGIVETVASLKHRGIQLKIVTGDHHLLAIRVGQALGLTSSQLITGSELRLLEGGALVQAAVEKELFAEIEPLQKEQIISALRKSGRTVGFLGDGINDVAALHSADVGISVEGGASAAKEAADIVLQNKDLQVLCEGVEEGRHTFVNTMKYVYMATSANFGNMFSMAGASLFLPFLPLLPKQVLLTNFLTDFPEMTIASDRVDPESVSHPIRWDLPTIRRFMIIFGVLSSVFDYVTFGLLLYWFNADPDLFRTGWFIESVTSATLVVLVIRTKRSCFISYPSALLAFAVVSIAVLALFAPWIPPLAEFFNFVPLAASFYLFLAAILGAYLLLVEIGKRRFFRKMNHEK